MTFVNKFKKKLKWILIIKRKSYMGIWVYTCKRKENDWKRLQYKHKEIVSVATTKWIRNRDQKISTIVIKKNEILVIKR